MARLLALQRTAGNRRVGRLLRRERTLLRAPVEAALAPGLEPGPEINLRAVEEAQHHAATMPLYEQRVLSAAEIDEVGYLVNLARPVGPLAAGPGTTKLTDAVAKLGKMLAGAPHEYERDYTLPWELTWIKGDPEDPDGRIVVTPDGVLVVEKTVRTPQKVAKGKPKLPDKLSWIVKRYDMRGVALRERDDVMGAKAVYATARAEIEAPVQKRVLGELGALETDVAGAGGETHMTLGEVVAEADPSVYVQTSSVGWGENKRSSELFNKVQAAFEALRAEFAAFVASRTATPGAEPPSHAEMANAFADRLVPAYSQTLAAAQATLDQLTKAKSDAKAEVDAATAAVADLKKRAATTKEEKAALAASKKEAQARLNTARTALTSATRAVTKQTGVVQALTAERDRHRQDIAYMLDPNRTTARLAGATVGALCNVLSYFLYGKAVGVVPPETDFKDYYLEQVKLDRIRRDRDTGGVYYGTGSPEWARERGMVIGRVGDKDWTVPIGHISRRTELNTFLASEINLAITHQDLKNDPPKKAHHFMLIIKDENGNWRNLDHTSSSYQRRGAFTDWNRVFRIDADAALLAEARRKLGL